MNRPARRLLCGSLLLAFFAGCGGPEPRPKIAGSVSYQGAPIGNQTLTLHFDAPANEFFMHRVFIKSDGTFAADAPVIGKYKVVIEPSMAAMEGKPAGVGAVIPKKYRAAATTDLVWEIGKGMNQRDFDLTD